jgi:hypothetical protein
MSKEVKIRITIDPSELSKDIHISPQDMGLSDEGWANLSDADKERYIDRYIENMPEQPYWVIDRWKEL